MPDRDSSQRDDRIEATDASLDERASMPVTQEGTTESVTDAERADTPADPDSVARPRARRFLTYLRKPQVLLGLTVVLVALTLGLSAATSSPRVCASCHLDQAEAASKTPHANIACGRCHGGTRPSARFEFKLTQWTRMYPRAIGGVRLAGPTTMTTRGACLRCHAGVLDATTAVNGLRISHEFCAEGSCGGCHTDDSHPAAVRWRRGAVMDDCIHCHNRQSASRKCDTCHDGRIQAQRVATGPWQITHGPNWRTTHGMGDLHTCSTCHAASKCVSCHKTPIPHEPGYLNRHGKESLAKNAGCATCHKRADWCTSCHGVEMPHPRGFLKRHTKVATSRSDETCTRCHENADCVNCHRAHIHPGLPDEVLKTLAPGVE